MRKLVLAVLLVVVVVGAGVVFWAWRGLAQIVEGAAGADDVDVDVDTLLAKHRAAFLADLAAVDAIAALRPHDGEDAGPLLNPKVPWRSQGQDVRPLPIPAPVEKALANNERWLELVDDAGVSDVDTSLLRGLTGFG